MGKKQIAPFFPPLEKFWKNPLLALPGKNASDAMHLWIRQISLKLLPCWFSVCGKPHHLAPIVYLF